MIYKKSIIFVCRIRKTQRFHLTNKRSGSDFTLSTEENKATSLGKKKTKKQVFHLNNRRKHNISLDQTEENTAISLDQKA